MSEHLRYAFGRSSLGAFFAAWSEQGIVALAFSERPEDTLARLQARCPGAVIAQDQDGLREMMDVLRAAIDHPERACDLALDMRGTDFEKRVWNLLRQIPAGITTHYGAIAAEMGMRDARQTTEAIANNPVAVLVPCHRVVKKDGSISGYRWGVERKRALLKREQQVSEFTLSG